MIMFTVNDFTKGESNGNWHGYVLNKECKIFGKPFNKKIELSIHKNQTLEKSIAKIDEYMTWLSGDACKDILISELCEVVNEYSAVTPEYFNETKWFETLQVYSVLVTVTEDGRLGADVSAGDNYDDDHVLTIELIEQEVDLLYYDG